MNEYSFVDQENGAVKVCKWTGNDVPAAIYVVKGSTCDCPAGTHYGRCKHPKMVKLWSDLGKPQRIFPETIFK